jgi:hypothetical protein
MDVAEAILDSRHHITFQAAAALLSPGFFLIRFQHRMILVRVS